MKHFHTTTTTVAAQRDVAQTGLNASAFVLLCMAFCLFISLNSMSQNVSNSKATFGVGINSQISGDGHGTFYTPYVQAQKGNNILTAGACLQKRSSQLCGGRISFTHLLTGRNIEDMDSADVEESLTTPEHFRRVQLNLFGFVQYVNNIPLSYHCAQIETMAKAGSDRTIEDYSKARLSTLEGGAGIGLNFKISKNATLGSYVGVGAYYYTQYVQGMYKDRMMPMVILGTSFSFTTSH